MRARRVAGLARGSVRLQRIRCRSFSTRPYGPPVTRQWKFLLSAIVIGSVFPVITGSAPATAAACSSDHYRGSSRVVRLVTTSAQPAAVLLPASYEADPSRRYPVLYLLHGALSNTDSWLVRTDIVDFT